MAWQAKNTTPVSKGAQDTRLYVHVVYYDDVDPATILHERDFVFDPATTGPQMRQTLLDEGVAARTALAKATGINQAFPTGSVFLVP